MTVALYRRYRPESFDELIGQTQVTDPLRAALRHNRVNHAYLFSGPRGCGKTTSARILARCLNCAEGPTDTPCGKCPSCIELSRDGGGSLDVVEIDAASHNGVDDARELRERAAFAPARDRYKIFILDEAHMVTQQGFNALLKLVEEPPEHVKFIFATTEPEKVIPTIRSRTHHYPFRLVPPATMLDYVSGLCESEKVTVDDGVLPLVIRAGGGSVRDTLSLLDQIMAGSDTERVTKERTNNLLGYTPSELLDDIIEAVGRGDAAAAFTGVDRVIQTGNDPRRFVEDVLERFRDLVIVDATGEGAPAVLRGVPSDEIARMGELAALYGSARLSDAADIVNAALSGMTGTTPPRIHLELMLARLLTELPNERAVKTPAPAVAQARPATPPATRTEPVKTAAAREIPSSATSVSPVTPPAASEPAVAIASVPVETGTLTELLDVWPELLEELKSNAGAWVVINAARPAGLDGDVLTLEFGDQLFVDRFKEQPSSGKAVFEELREAIMGAIGVRYRFVPKLGPGAVTVSPPAPATAAAPTAPAPVQPHSVTTEPPVVEDAPTTRMPKIDDEPRGEAVIRDILGATLVSTVDNGSARKSVDEPTDTGEQMLTLDASTDESE